MTRNYKKNKKRPKNRLARRLRRLFLPFLLLFCILAFLFPEQTGSFLGSIEKSYPQAGRIAEILGISEHTENTGTQYFEVHFLDVGEGLSVLVRSDEHAMLYDGGNADSSSFVVSYLKQQGISTLDYIIASHYDADHISGLIGALHVFDVQNVIAPDYTHGSSTYESFIRSVEEKGLTIHHPSVGETFSLGSSSFTVLSPEHEYEDSNNNSIAVRIANGKNHFLVTGDAEEESENDICTSGLRLQSDVLCCGHHGSSNATTDELLSAVKPDYAVISCGAGNEYGHPHWETLQKLEDQGVTVYRTDESGTIIAYSDGNDIWWESEF